MGAKFLEKPLKFLLATLVVLPAFVIDNAVAGVDFSQVDLFAPFALILPAIGLVILMLAYGIRAVNRYFRLVAHLLFVVAVVFFASYLYAYILQLPKFESTTQTILFMLPIAFVVFQCWYYLTASSDYTGFKKKPLYAVAVILFFPVLGASIFIFGEKKSSNTRSGQSAGYQESTIDGGRANGQLSSRRRERSLPTTRPAPPPKPVVIVPKTNSAVITVKKKSVQTRTRE